MAYFCYFSFGENLDFPDFLQKKFYNIYQGIWRRTEKTNEQELGGIAWNEIIILK